MMRCKSALLQNVLAIVVCSALGCGTQGHSPGKSDGGTHDAGRGGNDLGGDARVSGDSLIAEVAEAGLADRPLDLAREPDSPPNPSTPDGAASLGAEAGQDSLLVRQDAAPDGFSAGLTEPQDAPFARDLPSADLPDAGVALDLPRIDGSDRADAQLATDLPAADKLDSAVDHGFANLEVGRDAALGLPETGDARSPDQGGNEAGPPSFQVGYYTSKLVSDPQAGLLYALDVEQVHVFDTAAKTKVATVTLHGHATDLDLSSDGQILIAAIPGSKQIDVIDKQHWTAAAVDTRLGAWQVEVANDGLCYYADEEQTSGVRHINLRQGIATDVEITWFGPSEADLELSASGDRLYVAESGTSGSDLYALDLDATYPEVDRSHWNDDGGFPDPPRTVYLGPSGQHIYYAGHQLDAMNLTQALGDIGVVFAEDAAGTFAVSSTGFVDAKLFTQVAKFTYEIGAAALTNGDTELWYKQGTRLVCVPVSQFLSGITLGQRQSAAGPLASYTFSRLIADPVRARLYGLDAKKNLVVSIDSASGTPLRAQLIEYAANDLAIDPSGHFIYVAHSGMEIEQIEAETLTQTKYVFTPHENHQLALLGNSRIATIDFDQWTTATILDIATGSVLGDAFASWQGSISATADGGRLYIGGADQTDSLTRFDVATGEMLNYAAGNEMTSPGRGVVVTPNGASVYYGGLCLNGVNITETRYVQPDRIIAVSPNSLLAASATTIYRVSDGATLKTLPVNCAIQAFSPDSSTIYCYASSAITKISLAGLT